MILFLDFDGVLHAPKKDGLFARVSQFEEALEKHPQIEIIISSSWRESHSLEQLKAIFTKDFSKRIKGVTPVFEFEPVEWADGSGFFMGSQGLRQKEIEAYMGENYPPHTPWIAIDDMPELFSEDASLIYTPEGFNEKSIEELDHWVKAIKGRPVFSI